MNRHRIVLATPHPRHDPLERSLRDRHRIDVLRVRDAASLEEGALAAFAPSFVMLPHWSWKIPATIHERFECVIFHMTDVPFGRGGSPLQNLIARGIAETRICALRCVEEMDAGPVYLRRPLSLHGSAEEILLRASAVIEDMILELLETRPVPVAQQGQATIFRRRRPEEGNLARARSMDEAFDLVRMLDADGYPPAFLDVGPFRLEFTRAARRLDAVLADVRIRLREGDGSS